MGATARASAATIWPDQCAAQTSAQLATKLLETLAVETEDASSRVRRTAGESTRAKPEPQLSLFTEFLPHPAVETLRSMSLDAMTPLQAFDALRELVRTARGGG
ncbi:MAG: hypothetical protein U0572_14090 [Phycisphaerales bacterium]